MELVEQLRAEEGSLRGSVMELDWRGIAPKKGAACRSHASVVEILARLGEQADSLADRPRVSNQLAATATPDLGLSGSFAHAVPLDSPRHARVGAS